MVINGSITWSRICLKSTICFTALLTAGHAPDAVSDRREGCAIRKMEDSESSHLLRSSILYCGFLERLRPAEGSAQKGPRFPCDHVPEDGVLHVKHVMKRSCKKQPGVSFT